MNKLMTNELTVKYSHITKPDDKFGQGKYKVTVIADDHLLNTLKDECNKNGVDFASTYKEKDGDKIVTFTSSYVPKLFVREGTTPREKGFAWGGDVVRVDATLKKTEVMGKTYVSRYINRIELVTVNEREQADIKSPFGDNSTEVSAEDFKHETPEEEVTAMVEDSNLPF